MHAKRAGHLPLNEGMKRAVPCELNTSQHNHHPFYTFRSSDDRISYSKLTRKAETADADSTGDHPRACSSLALGRRVLG